MKAAMDSHIAQERHTMFQSSVDNVRNRLNAMVKGLESTMLDKVDEVFIMVRRDYNSVLGEGEVPQTGELLPKTQRLVRKEIMRIIDGVRIFSSNIFLVDHDTHLTHLTAPLFTLRNADLGLNRSKRRSRGLLVLRSKMRKRVTKRPKSSHVTLKMKMTLLARRRTRRKESSSRER